MLAPLFEDSCRQKLRPPSIESRLLRRLQPRSSARMVVIWKLLFALMVATPTGSPMVAVNRGGRDGDRTVSGVSARTACGTSDAACWVAYEASMVTFQLRDGVHV